MGNSDVVIRVEGLGKSYAIHHEQPERYTALRDVVARQVRTAGLLLNPFTLAGQLRKAQRQTAEAGDEEFWALKDVSFEIRRGERVGVIGRNGAGKSTLLKILSRITEPTTGRVEIRGRVASLLEVGTGFHPELTGRENIYLNGAILGMTRREIRSKFDEIVDFAEVEKFLDTPVKRYSSGMYVRLAFAVAAHLEPEILVVDEVLAVGDASFQKKCLGKMKDVSGEGRTVIFVSHQMDVISSLCERTLLLQSGMISADDETKEAIAKYLQTAKPREQATFRKAKLNNGIPFQILSAELLNEGGVSTPTFDMNENIKLKVKYVVSRNVIGGIVKMELSSGIGDVIFWSFDTDKSPHLLSERKIGTFESIVIPAPLLKVGSYTLSLGTGIANSEAIEDLKGILEFEVVCNSESLSFKSYSSKRPGKVCMPLEWSTRVLSD